MTLAEFITFVKGSTHHRSLYHFTDEANFPSIDKYGILSKSEMRARGWWPNFTGGNALSHELDTARGIDPYVSLCLTRSHRMKYIANKDGRLPNPRYLAILPDVLQIEGVRVAFGIANANGVTILPIEEAIEHLDKEVVYTRTDWANAEIQNRLQIAEKVEVLIPNAVPRNLILGHC